MDTVKYIDFPSEKFNPIILCSFFFQGSMKYKKGFTLKERNVYDYELEFFTDSDGEMFIDNKLYNIKKGDVVFRKPGQTTQGIMPYSCYLICFDPSNTSDKDPESYDFCKQQKISSTKYQNYLKNPILESIPTVFHPFADSKYNNIFEKIMQEFITPSITSKLLLKSYLLQLLSIIYEDTSNPLNAEINYISPYNESIKQVVKYIKENIGEKILLNDLADIANLSPNYFHKIFKEVMNLTPNEFIIKTRLEKGKELLVRSNKQVFEIAIECGFENTPYFSYIFKKYNKISPVRYRENCCYYV